MAASFITTLNQIQTGFTDYFMPVVFIIGTITNIFNMVLFGRRKLRLNCCSWYFICLSLSQLLLLVFNCLLRVISSRFNYNGFSTVDFLCKIRAYFTVLTLVLVRHFISLISIDRWLVTSSNIWLRNQSSLSNVRWIISCSVIFWTIFSIHAPIAYIIKPSGCSPTNHLTYSVFSAIYTIITSCGPFFIAIIFSILTLRNIRKSNRRIDPLTVIPTHTVASPISFPSRRTRVQKKQRREMNFVRLAFFQIIPYLLFNLISSFSPIILYVNAVSIDRTTESTAIVTFIHTFGSYLLYLYVSITFVFYTLASNIFRQEFIGICKQCGLIIRHCIRSEC